MAGPGDRNRRRPRPKLPARLRQCLRPQRRHLWEGDLAEGALVFICAAPSPTRPRRARRRTIPAEQVARPIADALADDPDATRRAAMVGSQLLGVALCRYILRLEAIVSISSEALAADLGPTLQRYLTCSQHDRTE